MRTHNGIRKIKLRSLMNLVIMSNIDHLFSIKSLNWTYIRDISLTLELRGQEYGKLTTWTYFHVRRIMSIGKRNFSKILRRWEPSLKLSLSRTKVDAWKVLSNTCLISKIWKISMHYLGKKVQRSAFKVKKKFLPLKMSADNMMHLFKLLLLSIRNSEIWTMRIRLTNLMS